MRLLHAAHLHEEVVQLEVEVDRGHQTGRDHPHHAQHCPPHVAVLQAPRVKPVALAVLVALDARWVRVAQHRLISIQARGCKAAGMKPTSVSASLKPPVVC